MTQYLLSVHMVEGDPIPSEEEIQQAYKDVDAFNEEVKAQGAWVFGGGLHPADTATVVRVKDGEVLTTDGPFAETKEQLGGYYLIQCENLDEATEAAARIPAARGGTIEVRPIFETEREQLGLETEGMTP
ncbi:MAG: YciI family protein [Actinomycetota bacterium]|nr:YciI family protein [Actinomycetota bacterium]